MLHFFIALPMLAFVLAVVTALPQPKGGQPSTEEIGTCFPYFNCTGSQTKIFGTFMVVSLNVWRLRYPLADTRFGQARGMATTTSVATASRTSSPCLLFARQVSIRCGQAPTSTVALMPDFVLLLTGDCSADCDKIPEGFKPGCLVSSESGVWLHTTALEALADVQPTRAADNAKDPIGCVKL